MRRIRFRTIFSRMLFMQCLTVALSVLLLGIVLTVVVHAQRRQEFGTQLNRYAQTVRSRLSDGSADSEARIRIVAEENDLLIERIGAHGTVKAYFADEKWRSFSELGLSETAYERIVPRASEIGDDTASYFKDADFPVLTVYCTAADATEGGLLLIVGDLRPLRSATAEMLLWTVLISVIGLIASGVVSYYTSYRVIHPFVEMNRAVQCYSRGDFSTRIPVEGRDEAAQLGKSLNEMAEQLRGLEDTRRSFVANVSHELRSPLTSMKGFLEAMQDGTIPEESFPEYIGIVLN